MLLRLQLEDKDDQCKSSRKEKGKVTILLLCFMDCVYATLFPKGFQLVNLVFSLEFAWEMGNQKKQIVENKGEVWPLWGGRAYLIQLGDPNHPMLFRLSDEKAFIYPHGFNRLHLPSRRGQAESSLGPDGEGSPESIGIMSTENSFMHSAHLSKNRWAPSPMNLTLDTGSRQQLLKQGYRSWEWACPWNLCISSNMRNNTMI